MTNEELQKHRAEILKNLEEVEYEAGWLVKICQFAKADLMEVETEKDAKAWDEKYAYVEDNFKHIKLW